MNVICSNVKVGSGVGYIDHESEAVFHAIQELTGLLTFFVMPSLESSNLRIEVWSIYRKLQHSYKILKYDIHVQ